MIYAEQGRYEESDKAQLYAQNTIRDLYSKERQLSNTKLGSALPSIMQEKLGQALLEGGRSQQVGSLDEALSHHQTALDLRETMFGRDSPQVYKSIRAMGVVNREHGNLHEALKCYQQDLEFCMKKHGKWHADVAKNLGNIAKILHSLKRDQEALEKYQEVLEIVEIVQGYRHPDMYKTNQNIAQICVDLHRFKEASEAVNENLIVQRDKLGKDHPEVATTLIQIGKIKLQWGQTVKGKNNEAFEHFHSAFMIRERKFGKKHHSIAECLTCMGDVRKAQDPPRLEEALDYYERALKLDRKFEGKTAHLASDLDHIGSVYKAFGNLKKSLQKHKESSTINRQCLGDNDPEVARTIINIGGVYKDMGKNDKAMVTTKLPAS